MSTEMVQRGGDQQTASRDDDVILQDTQLDGDVMVGIPSYNEEVAIGSVVLQCKRLTDTVVVVDDGSHDRTADIAADAGATVIRHGENRGKGSAMRSLLAHARRHEPDALVVLDGDGQHLPEDIPDVVAPVTDGDSDMVIGSRYLEGDKTETPLHRRFGQRVLDVLTLGSSGTNLSDTQSGFRAFSPTAVDRLTVRTDGMGVESEMIGTATENDLEIEEVSIDVKYEDVDGQTYNPLHHGLSVMLFTLRLIRDRHPLLFFGLPGIMLLGGGGGIVTNAALLYHSSGAFHQWQILLGGFMVLIGMMALFSGLVLNQIANMMVDLDE